ncbi:MAG: Ppx/GppA family phosphatase [Myxococcota bacterium]|nr:Ppx/GppA family phosphatase [Myxococcota bacterium]
MKRYATIDVGTNSVLLLVAELKEGRFEPLVERAEITRLGRGVDRSGALDPAAIEETIRCLESFAQQARALGVQAIAATATSAARDASNGAVFREEAKRRAGVELQIISGELEAQLSFAAVHTDFAGSAQGPLVALDIGGGSTEFIFGTGDGPQIAFRHSFDVGSVRLTERFVTGHPVSPADRERIRAHLKETFASLPAAPPGFQLVGVAGTVTTLFSVLHQIDPYDAARVHGGRITHAELATLVDRLCELPLEERRRLPGLQPKRADVICAGALVLEGAMEQLGAQGCVVSDRGLRWGLLVHQFGNQP